MSPQPTSNHVVSGAPGTCHQRERYEQLTRQWQSIAKARARRLHEQHTRQAAQWREQFAALQRQTGALMAQGRWVRGRPRPHRATDRKAQGGSAQESTRSPMPLICGPCTSQRV